jgi:hypothetical protein
MMVWCPTDSSTVGCIAGYSGGGAFQCEKYIIHDGDIDIECDTSFSTIANDNELVLADLCLDEVMKVHDVNRWFDSDNLVLRDPNLLNKGNISNDLLFAGEQRIPLNLMPLFDKIGLISRPTYCD